LDNFQKFIATSRYAKYIDDKGRRETWEETVDRYVTNVVQPVAPSTVEDLRSAITNMEVMPSMRMMMSAGPALERDNVAGYNCSYLPVDHPRSFDECLYILMCGTGVGFSVERQYTSKLPEVLESFTMGGSTIVVKDSKIGWAEGLKELVALLYAGLIPSWDLSKLRPAGARLKTFGGRSSGPEPLDRLFKFVVDTFKAAKGRRLSSIECHDIMCKIGECVVVGGVRRSALISLSNLSDDRMRHAKSGQWWDGNAQRALANNSVCYTEKPTFDSFLREWTSLYESKSGERGIFYRGAAKKVAAKNGRRDSNQDFGTNPCSEIILRPYQFC
jgi:ribonucleoside-diphosphate reductase alpha chain